jgi:hypothetical protein
MSVAFDSEIAAAPSGSRSSPRRAPPADPDRRDHDRALRDRRRPTRYRIQAATPEPGWTMPARTQEQGSTGRRVSALLLATSRPGPPDDGHRRRHGVVLPALAFAAVRAPVRRSGRGRCGRPPGAPDRPRLTPAPLGRNRSARDRCPLSEVVHRESASAQGGAPGSASMRQRGYRVVGLITAPALRPRTVKPAACVRAARSAAAAVQPGVAAGLDVGVGSASCSACGLSERVR